MKFYEPKGINELQNKDIPNSPGVYFFWSKNELLYIGNSYDLRRRIAAHFSEGFPYLPMVNPKLIWKVSIILVKNKDDAKRIERQLIDLIPTKFNKNPFYKSMINSKDNIDEALESYEKLF